MTIEYPFADPRPKKGPDKRPKFRAIVEDIDKARRQAPGRLDGAERPPELEYVWSSHLPSRPIDSLGVKPYEIQLLRNLASTEQRVLAVDRTGANVG